MTVTKRPSEIAEWAIQECDHGVSLDEDCLECAKIGPPAIKCYWCGRFAKSEDTVWETPYSSSGEYEEGVPVCAKCRE